MEKYICPLCYNIGIKKRFTILTQEKISKKIKALKCKKCGLIFLSDYKRSRNEVYDEKYLIWKKSKINEALIKSKIKSFKYQLKPLLFYKKEGGKLLDIGTGRGYLLDIAKNKGFDVYGVELSQYHAKHVGKRFPGKVFNGSFEDAKYPNNYFDFITAIDVLEHLNYPNKFFEKVSKILKPKGFLLLTTPNTDSVTRKILSKRWFQYKDEHILYYNKKSIKYALNKYNLKIKKYTYNKRILSLIYYYYYFKKYRLPLISNTLKFVFPLFPRSLKDYMFKNPLTGEMYVIVQKI